MVRTIPSGLEDLSPLGPERDQKTSKDKLRGYLDRHVKIEGIPRASHLGFIPLGEPTATHLVHLPSNGKQARDHR